MAALNRVGAGSFHKVMTLARGEAAPSILESPALLQEILLLVVAALPLSAHTKRLANALRMHAACAPDTSCTGAAAEAKLSASSPIPLNHVLLEPSVFFV